jgi:hypothetical protein
MPPALTCFKMPRMRYRVRHSERMQVSSEECARLCEYRSTAEYPLPATPDTQVGGLPVLRSRMQRPRSTPTATTAPGRISATALAAPPATDASGPSMTACTSNYQRFDKEPLPIVTKAPTPASVKVHTDPIPEWKTGLESTLSHCVLPGTADQWVLEKETADNSNTPRGLLRQPINDGPPIEHKNADLVPVMGCPSVETSNTNGTALRDGASEEQRKWAQGINNIRTIAELEDHLLQYREAAKFARWFELPRQPRTRRPRPRGPNPPRRRQQQMYDAKSASCIKKLYRRCRPRTFREVAEAESPFCEIPADEFHEHFSPCLLECYLSKRCRLTC